MTCADTNSNINGLLHLASLRVIHKHVNQRQRLEELEAWPRELHALKVDLYLHLQGIDTTTPAGKALFQMCGVFAEFERSMLQERVKAGLARARANGKRLGRPPVPPKLQQRARSLRAKGRSVRAIATKLRLSVGAVHALVSKIGSATAATSR